MPASTSSTASPCSRCARALGRSCCEVGPGEALATLTSSDVQRIVDATGLLPSDFVEREPLTERETRDYVRHRPAFLGYFRDSTTRFTLRKKDGACVLWSAGKGCTLDASTRPITCRLYPFEWLPDGDFGLNVSRFDSLPEARAAVTSATEAACLAVEEADSMESLASRLGTSRGSLESLASQLRNESAAHDAGAVFAVL